MPENLNNPPQKKNVRFSESDQYHAVTFDPNNKRKLDAVGYQPSKGLQDKSNLVVSKINKIVQGLSSKVLSGIRALSPANPNDPLDKKSHGISDTPDVIAARKKTQDIKKNRRASRGQSL